MFNSSSHYSLLSFIHFTRPYRKLQDRRLTLTDFLNDLSDVTNITWIERCKQWERWRILNNIPKKFLNITMTLHRLLILLKRILVPDELALHRQLLVFLMQHRLLMFRLGSSGHLVIFCMEDLLFPIFMIISFSHLILFIIYIELFYNLIIRLIICFFVVRPIALWLFPFFSLVHAGLDSVSSEMYFGCFSYSTFLWIRSLLETSVRMIF